MSSASDRTRRELVRMLALGVPLIGSAACATTTPPSAAGSLPDFVGLVDRVAPSVVAVGDAKQTVASGFAVAETLVITAAHAVQGLGAGAVVTSAQGRHAARVLGTREEDDVALLEVTASLPMLSLATTLPRVGEWIVVVGNPFGAGMTVTAGIVSAAPGAIAATPELARRIQINAAVNPGNSGGPVCNLRGEVVGATTSLVAGGQGIAFATSSLALRDFLSTRK